MRAIDVSADFDAGREIVATADTTIALDMLRKFRGLCQDIGDVQFTQTLEFSGDGEESKKMRKHVIQVRFNPLGHNTKP